VRRYHPASSFENTRRAKMARAALNRRAIDGHARYCCGQASRRLFAVWRRRRATYGSGLWPVQTPA